jgi:ribosome-associated protein
MLRGKLPKTSDPARAAAFAIDLARTAHALNCEDVTCMDLRGICGVTDFSVICTGTSDRQMRATADHMVELGKKIDERPYGISGYETATWVLLDYIDVVVHIFARPYRDYYDLELLWGDAPRLEWRQTDKA